MSSLLVNIRGTNGAGKSTIPLTMMNKDKKLEVVGLGKNKKNRCATSPFITIFHSYEWIALGSYHSKCGGMDTFKNKEMTETALEYAWTKYPEYDILMEGIIASTVKSTYADLFKSYQQRVVTDGIPDRKILIMNFLPPVEVCVQRIYERNGGKPVKEEQVRSKWNTVNRNVEYFREQGFDSIRIDTSKTSKEQMIIKFLNYCDRYKEEE